MKKRISELHVNKDINVRLTVMANRYMAVQN